MDDQTRVPLGWIFGLIVALLMAFAFTAGVIVWGANLDARATDTTQRVAAIETKQTAQEQENQEIIARLSRIEGYLQKRNGH